MSDHPTSIGEPAGAQMSTPTSPRRRSPGAIPFDAFHVSTAMALVAALAFPPPRIHPVALVVMAIGLVAPLLPRRFPWYWSLVLALSLTNLASSAWMDLDNHEFLRIYWFGAIAVSRFGHQPDEILRVAARTMIGLVFAFAVTWKLLAPAFISGAGYEFMFSTDPRLAGPAVALSMQPEEAVERNQEALRRWTQPGTVPAPQRLVIGHSIRRIAPAMAWLTIFVEGAIALAFLLPLASRHRWLRDAVLLSFIVITYPLTPIVGFAWLLISMGVMQSGLPSRLRNSLYIAAFLLVALMLYRRELVYPVLESIAAWF